MIVRIHGFDWGAYTERVMPAFARWLVDGDSSFVSELYQQTQNAREESFLPAPLRPVCSWPRAQTFVKQLPRGTHTLPEYQALCTPTLYTPLSDSYIHRHPPQLYQQSEALRVIWGALVTEYCQSWFTLPSPQQEVSQPAHASSTPALSRHEMISFLHAAGLKDLAQEIKERATEPLLLEDEDAEEIEEVMKDERSLGVNIGNQPGILHLRGWLASTSIRSMALFELLACGRRRMPFGYRANEPYENIIGYLTPEELWQLSDSLKLAIPPTAAQAEEDYALFRLQQHIPAEFRLLDEVLPTHAETFLMALRLAAQYGLGLLCTVG
ncbi:hypothetical protein [Tengunoibacter tsumagoiensis]|uniref:Uncharacterized protein n=1 Tax=Tengunoibacter tsumagoiensis TaxID=2014871 RepID=A0A402A2N5_9CHLR|nr:hypothetical protein [Tengunoibacter tsumagoiensis]GCE13315.1 hypothetical protein KTT_31740 [Tengunoibacter tsumagoiensis]